MWAQSRKAGPVRYRRIPDQTVQRLPSYLRALHEAARQGQGRICSEELAQILPATALQIRKDLSHFGCFGTPGRGYDVEKLIGRLNKILKLEETHLVALAGAGNLGTALLRYPGFARYGFRIAAVFDTDPKKIGKSRHGLTIEDLASLPTLRDRGIRLGMLAVPSAAAQQVAEMFARAGVLGILNFTPCCLTLPKSVRVVAIDIAAVLAALPYHLPVPRPVINTKEE